MKIKWGRKMHIEQTLWFHLGDGNIELSKQFKNPEEYFVYAKSKKYTPLKSEKSYIHRVRITQNEDQVGAMGTD